MLLTSQQSDLYYILYSIGVAQILGKKVMKRAHCKWYTAGMGFDWWGHNGNLDGVFRWPTLLEGKIYHGMYRKRAL